MRKTMNEAQKLYRSLIGNADQEAETSTDVDPFEGLFDDISDSVDDVEDSVIQDPPTVTSDNAEETPPAAVETPAEEVETKPVVETPAVEEPPTVVEEEVTPAEPVNQEEVLKQLHEGFAKQYQLDEETADQFLTDPAVALPKLAAQLHVNILSHVMQLIQTHLPQQITQVQEMAVKRQTIESQFKEAWPDLDLNKPEISEVVTEASKLAKQRYPKAEMSELIQKTGLIAHALMGTVSAGQAPAVAPTPAASPKPVSPTPSRQTVHPATPAVKNEWDMVLDEFKED